MCKGKRKRLFTVLLTIIALYVNNAVVDSAGCIFLRDDKSIRCQNTSIQDVEDSLHILTMVVNNKPKVIDIEDCRGATVLSPIFNRINSSIETVRIRRSGIQSLYIETFIPFADTLSDLDMSHNQLISLPEALMVLRSLQYLNLQHNRIVFVRPSSIFDGLPNLREFNLAHNYIGQAEEIDDRKEQQGYQIKGVLTLEDLTLGKAVRSLESLSLKGNRLVSIPLQITNHSLPRLKYLDLSENVIGKADDLKSTHLPNLEFLDLHSNRLQGVSFYSLPVTLKYLDLTENPFYCNCASRWLYDWYLTNSTIIRFPVCNSPEILHRKGFEKIPWRTYCPTDNNTTASFRYTSESVRGYDVIQLTPGATYINISWKVKAGKEAEPKRWTVVYRKATDSPYQMTLGTSAIRHGKSSNTHEALLTEKIQNLDPSTTYIVCIALIQDDKYTIEPDKCRRVITKGYEFADEFGRRLNSDTVMEKLMANIKTVLEDITVSAQAITIKWKILHPENFNITDDSTSVRHEWTLKIRRTGSDNYTDIPVYDITNAAKIHDQLYEYGVSDLASHTLYDVCLVDVDHQVLNDKTSQNIEIKRRQVRINNNQTSICRTVQTLGNYMLYATEIAAICFACAICIVVIIVTVYLCRQKQLVKWKPKKLWNWLTKTVSINDRPVPIGSSINSTNKFATATIPRVKYDHRTCPWTTNRAVTGTWNTLRLPYKEFTPQDLCNLQSQRAAAYKEALTTVTIYKSGHSEC